MSQTRADVLERLFATITSRKGGDPDGSYTASLFAKGLPKIAEKLGEEAIEAVVASMQGNKENIAQESADLLYHLLVLWAETDIAPEQVWAILEARTSVSGVEEKAARTETGKNSAS